jgi:hypothetical protein
MRIRQIQACLGFMLVSAISFVFNDVFGPTSAFIAIYVAFLLAFCVILRSARAESTTFLNPATVPPGFIRNYLMLSYLVLFVRLRRGPPCGSAVIY